METIKSLTMGCLVGWLMLSGFQAYMLIDKLNDINESLQIIASKK